MDDAWADEWDDEWADAWADDNDAAERWVQEQAAEQEEADKAVQAQAALYLALEQEEEEAEKHGKVSAGAGSRSSAGAEAGASTNVSAGSSTNVSAGASTNVSAGPSNGVRFQLFQVTVLPQGRLRTIKRGASAATRRKAVPNNLDKHVLLFGRTLEGVSVHVQLAHPAGFWMRVPLHWTQREVSAVAAALGALSAEVQQRSHFIGFTPHLPGNTNYDEPQRLPYAWLTFATDDKASKTFQSLRGYHGLRKSGYVWDSVLRKAGFGSGQRSCASVLQALQPEDLSVHDFADGEADLFDRINTMLHLCKPNLATYESWITLSRTVKWLPADEHFANSDRNALIRLSDIVAVENTLELAPMSMLSYDVEQFSHTAADTGVRGFPNSGCWQDHLEQIACSFTPDAQSLTAPPPYTRVFVRQAAKFRDPADPIVQNMEIVVCGSEAELLLRWAQEVRERQPDILTGYGLVVFDNKAVFYRAYLFYLCQSLSYETVLAMWRKAHEFVPQFEDMMAETAASEAASRKEACSISDQVGSGTSTSKSKGNSKGKSKGNGTSTSTSTTKCTSTSKSKGQGKSAGFEKGGGSRFPATKRERDDLMRQWFGISTNSSSAECRVPPVAFLVLHTVPDMDEATYSYFHAGPRIDMFFFFGKIPTWEIGFASSMYSTAAAGELPQEFFSNVGFAQLCGWYMMKKSYGGLAKFGLADVMAKFCPSMPKLADMPYNLMFSIIERGDDAEQLGDVARYCGVDALCVLHLMHSLQRIIEMRQFAALMRVSIKDLSRCGQQHIVMSKIRESLLVLGYVFNSFEPQARSFDGATVLEPLPGFYADPVATLDFASLYPSIMVGNNICPSTVLLPAVAREYGVPYTKQDVLDYEQEEKEEQAHNVQQKVQQKAQNKAQHKAQNNAQEHKAQEHKAQHKAQEHKAQEHKAQEHKAQEHKAQNTAQHTAQGLGGTYNKAHKAQGRKRLQGVKLLTVTVDDQHMPSFVQRVEGKPPGARNFGVVTLMLEEMLAARKAVKKLMAGATGLIYNIYNMRQLALKVACNSTYGFFGVKEGKVPITDISAAVTAIGRRMIYDTKKTVEDKGYTVVYGDTDSVMVYMPGKNMDDAWAATRELAHFITNVLFGHIASVSIEAEKVFLRSIFGEKKKRYFGLCNEGGARDKVTGEYVFKMMCKGFELVRRDACPFINDITRQAIDLMMTRTGDNRAHVTGPRIRAMLVRELQRVVKDELPMHKYYLNKCARSTYKALPAHIYVFRMHNDRVRSGEMAKVGEHNRALNAVDGADRPVKFEMYHSGTRFDYIVCYKRGAKVQRDHVEDPEWIKYHNSLTPNAAKRTIIDRLHYLQTYVTAVVPVLKYHVPDAAALFEAAAAQVHSQLVRHGTGTRPITHYTTTGQRAGQRAGQAAGQTAGQTASQTAGQTAGQAAGQTAGQPITVAQSEMTAEVVPNSLAVVTKSPSIEGSSMEGEGSSIEVESSSSIEVESSSSIEAASSSTPRWATQVSSGSSGNFKFMRKVTTALRLQKKQADAAAAAKAKATGVFSRSSIVHLFAKQAVRGSQAKKLGDELGDEVGDGPKQGELEEKQKDGSKQDGLKQDGPKQDGQKQDGLKEKQKDGPKHDEAKQDGPKQDGLEEKQKDGLKRDGREEKHKDEAKQDGSKQDASKDKSKKQRPRTTDKKQRPRTKDKPKDKPKDKDKDVEKPASATKPAKRRSSNQTTTVAAAGTESAPLSKKSR